MTNVMVDRLWIFQFFSVLFVCWFLDPRSVLYTWWLNLLPLFASLWWWGSVAGGSETPKAEQRNKYPANKKKGIHHESTISPAIITDLNVKSNASCWALERHT